MKAGRRTDHEGTYFEETRTSKRGKKSIYYGWKIVLAGQPIVIKRKTIEERTTEVRKALTKLEAQGFLTKSNADPTVAEKLNDWLEYRIKPSDREYNTYVSYKGAVDGYIIPTIGNVKASKVTAMHLQKIVAKAKAEGYDRMASYAPSVACRGLRLSIKTMKQDGLEMPDERIRDRVLSLEEITEVLDECYRERELKTRRGEFIYVYRDRHLILFLLNSALRISEALGVLSVRLSLRQNHVEVLEQLKRSKDEKGRPVWSLGKTKTGAATRTVPLNPEAMEAVKLQLNLVATDKSLAGEGYEDNGLLFATESGRPNSESNVLRTLGRVEKAINLNRLLGNLPAIEHFTIHDLRRSYITHLAGEEERIAYVAAIAGHASIQTTIKHYVFAQQKGMRDAAAKISFAGSKKRKA